MLISANVFAAASSARRCRTFAARCDPHSRLPSVAEFAAFSNFREWKNIFINL